MVYISQDGDHPGVSRLIQVTGKDLILGASAKDFQHWQHPREPVLGAEQACSIPSSFYSSHRVSLKLVPQDVPCLTRLCAPCKKLDPKDMVR